MALLNFLLTLLILTLSLLSAAAQPSPLPPPPQSILNAAETLANSGYNAMSLTLELIAPSLPLPFIATSATSLTIFSPPDASFSSSGQPSLTRLLLHFSPLSLSPASLHSLPFSSSIPSLSPSKHLVVTSTPPKKISLNNVGVSNSPIFDDGFVIVYAIDDFFDLNFTLEGSDSTKTNPNSGFQCLQLERESRFAEASGVLKSRGYLIMGSFLDLQLMGFLDHVESSTDGTKWTVFAPMDEELVQFSGDFLRYSLLFMRHSVPCKVGWNDLDEMANGTVVSNNVEGYSLVVTRDDDDETLMVNGVQIVVPDMYDSDWLVIHGIQGVIALPERAEEEDDGVDPSEEFPGEDDDESNNPDYGEF